MVAINYAKDIRVGEQPTKAVALGSNFVWPPLPERLFLRGQSLVYDFIKQRYGMRRPGHFTLVVGDTPVGPGFISDNMAVLLGDPESATGSISSQPLTGIDLGLAVFATSGSITQLNLYFLGDVVDSLEGIRFWVDGIEVEGPPDILVFHENPGFTAVAYNNPDMAPWVDGEHHIIAITLDGQELPDHPFEPPYSAITTLVAGETPTGIGYLSEEYAASQGAQELAAGSISSQPVSGFNLLVLEFAAAGGVTQLTALFQGDVEESLASIRVWVGGVEIEGPPIAVLYDANVDVTIVAYANPNMDPWVDGGQYTFAITLDGQEPPAEYYYTTEVNDLGILTRASTATYWGPSGTLLEAAVDEARIQHDPVTGEPLGLLVESGATNTAPNSENFSWVASSGSNDIIYFREENIPDPSGGFNATRVIKTGSNARFARSSYASGLTRSIYARTVSGEGSVYLLMMNGVSGSVRFVLDETWRRFEIPNAIHSQLHLVDFRGGSTLEEVLIWGFQSEDSPAATSYIPTTDSPVTRAADNAVVDLTDVLNPVEGTYVVRAVVKDDGEIEYYAGYYHLTISSRLSFRRLANGNFIFRAGSLYATMSPPAHLKSGDVVTLAVAYNEGQITSAAFGETSTSSSNYSPVETVNLVRGVGVIPSDNDRSLESSGIIAGFEYYPRALTEGELARITAFTSGDNS